MADQQGDELVQKLAARYTAGAAGYADHWQRMLAPLGAGLVGRLSLKDARRVLDVGCGPGTLMKAIRERTDALIVGIDHAAGMLRHAPGMPGMPLCLMDGRRLGFAAESFDVAVLAFMLFHYPDMVAGLREVRRVLRAGGAAGTATFAASPGFEAKRVWAEALADALPPDAPPVADLSRVDQGGRVNTPEKVRALFEAASFERIETHTEAYIYKWAPEDYLMVRSQFGSSGVAFRTLDAERQTALLAAVRERFAALPPEAFRFRPTVLYAVGWRPR